MITVIDSQDSISNVRPVSESVARQVLGQFIQEQDGPDTRWACTPSDDIWVSTVSGRRVSLLAPDPETIDIGDIAHSLSMICRFNGHLAKFYSVAEHSLFVSRIVEPRLAMVGLLHDAAEAYLGDMTSPVKKMLAQELSPAFKAAELRLWQAICIRFSVDPDLLHEVKHADEVALSTERRDLSRHDLHEGEGAEPHASQIRPTSAASARQMFARRFKALSAVGRA